MRFLCLHGKGTNNQVFEMQTAIRYELGDEHTFEFLEGSIPHPIAPGIDTLTSSQDEFFSYIDESSHTIAIKDCKQAFADLDHHLETNGPFGGIMAFSQGAGLAAAYIIYQARYFPEKPPPFSCAVFFSGSVPADPTDMFSQGKVRLLDAATDGEIISIPTAHIWGANDQLYPTFGPVLRDLCRRETRSAFIHEGGHDIPGAGSRDAVTKAVHVIKRAIAYGTEL